MKGVPDAQDFRSFFFQIFNQDTSLRRKILMQYHNPYPVCKKRHLRLADVFQEFIVDLLYEPVEFKLRTDHFCFFARGKPSLGVHYKWLKEKERSFIVYKAFANRKTLFKSMKQFENNQFAFEGFVHDPKPHDNKHAYEQLCDPMWQRELVRDFAWLVFAKRTESFVVLELIAALQEIMISHPVGKRDVFLCNLHNGLQGTCNVREVLCWNLEPYDIHSEEDYQKRQGKNAAARGL